MRECPPRFAALCTLLSLIALSQGQISRGTEDVSRNLVGREPTTKSEATKKDPVPGERDRHFDVSGAATIEQVPCINNNGEAGSCTLVENCGCSTCYWEIAVLSRSPCSITPTQAGVCCLSNNQTRSAGILDLKLEDLNNACNEGLEKLKEKEEIEEKLVKNKIVAKKGSPMFFHAQLFQTTPKIVQRAKDADKNVAASINLVKNFNLSKDQGVTVLPKYGVQNTIIASTCPKEVSCIDSKYRTIDGTCNNLRNTEWGRAGIAFKRFLSPEYDDGVDAPRQLSVSGKALLPSPRSISTRAIHHEHDVYENFTMLIMQWGQFLDHDITHTPITKGKNMSDITCCVDGKRREGENFHPDCLPIDIPLHDNFFQRHNQTCMDFVRSMPALRPECNFGPREQMNQITSFIDASNVYGSSDEEMRELRSFKGGELDVYVHNGHSLLPTNAEECTKSSEDLHCFKAGDSRVNEQPELTVMHTIWVRQHNKLASELSKLNPGWTDETIFQEARRIVAAQMQHITYNEYLPIILGWSFVESSNLLPNWGNHSAEYDANVDPTITNVFATAAFRYGHTLIPGILETYGKFGTVEDKLRLSENQFSPFVIYQKSGVDSLLRGLAKQPSEKVDHHFSEELTNHLFKHDKDFGMDLVALNIQRGRDHGLPNYNKWRQICNLPLAGDFNDLADVMSQEAIGRLQKIYENVNDIDVFIGGIAETPRRGSLLGHTFLCIVGDQFARLRFGDRFFYENVGFKSSFSEAQLNQIRQTSLARIMCDNSDNLEMIQPLVFYQAHVRNRRATCDGTLIPRMSLEPWRNEPV